MESLARYEDYVCHVSDYAQEWDEKFRDLVETVSPEEVIKYCNETGVKFLYREDYLLQYLIFLYTLENSEKVFEKVKNIILNNYSKYVLEISIKYNDSFRCDELYINTSEGEIHAIKLSERFPSIRKEFPIIDTKERNGKCFEYSYKIACNLGINCDLVTGFIYGNSDIAKFLHSFVETNIFGNDVVFDFTANILINKDAYYRIKHINEEETMQRISAKDIVEDLRNYGDLFNEYHIGISVYNTFRDKIISELSKKKRLK